MRISIFSMFSAVLLVFFFASENTLLAQVLPNTGDLQLRYTPATGEMFLYFTGTGPAGTSLTIDGVNVLTLGDGAIGPTMPAGISGVTAGQGALTGAEAQFPITTGFEVVNDNSPAGENGPYSEVSDINFAGAWYTFDKTNPGVSDVWSFGLIAPTGWSDDVLQSIFVTGNNSGATSLNYGRFSYLESGSNLNRLGLVVVPEPSTGLGAAGAAILVGLWFTLSRQRANKQKSSTV